MSSVCACVCACMCECVCPYQLVFVLSYRYPKTIKCSAEGLKLWPAYVCWARGHMKQATDFFMEAVSTLKDRQ